MTDTMNEWSPEPGVVLSTGSIEGAAPFVPPKVPLTAREFRMRFTVEERGAITLAASRGLEAGDPTLQVWLDDLSAAQTVDLDHPEIAAGLDGLVVAGLISKERRAAILS
jgi:hypothetical protein